MTSGWRLGIILSVLALIWDAPLHAERGDAAELALPRRLTLAEPVPSLDPGPDLAAALAPIAARLMAVPNPYEGYGAPAPIEERFDPPWLPVSQAEGERHWFQMEDSGDMMSTRLNENATAGFQVEFMGPAEEPKASRKIISIRGDPFHQRYLLTSAGLTVRF